MAAIKSKSSSSSLHSLTAAALLLPGLLQSPVCFAEDNEADFQYSHYQEGHRQLYSAEGGKSKFDPIEVESLHGGAKFTLADRIKLAFNYTEDTWSGATPITTSPLVFGGNNPIQTTTGKGKNAVTTVTGASPLIQPNGNIFVDTQFNPLDKQTIVTQTTRINKKGNPVVVKNSHDIYTKNSQLVHTLSSASPETRQQADFKLGYEWDNVAANLGGGISVERDYESRFVNFGGRWDFNQKLTSVNLGLSYTNSTTSATLDHFVTPYVERNSFFKDNVTTDSVSGKNILSGQREDWATQLGFTQILSKNSLLEVGAGYTRSTGYMSNPYKVMEILFVDPDQLSDLNRDASLPADVLTGQVKAFLEQRPELRNQWNLNTRYVQHIESLDAALHFDYRFYHDDWGINSHTFELNWGQPVGDSWMITPRVRYYSQTAADFYQAYLVSNQAFNKTTFNPQTLTLTRTPYDPAKLPSYFSSDQRLSGYGALSGGVTISKKFAKGLTLEAGFEYYTHKGQFKIGGGGENSYADFNYYTVNAGLKINLETLANARNSSEHSGHEGHAGHAIHASRAPAGVMFDHMLHNAGEIMLGYRYMHNTQAGTMQHGADFVDDLTVRKNACGQKRRDYCLVTATDHTMQMHMLDIMYAPTDWLNLMLMPQFMTMDMNFRALPTVKFKNQAIALKREQDTAHHIGHQHATSGIGDTSVYALLKLFDNSQHHVHVAIGMSAPTGNVGIQYRPIHHRNEPDFGFVHYGMQLGSGTWDFKPSVTYTGQIDEWSWGAQFSATKRLEKQNKSGFALGDVYQSTVWGGYSLFDWLSATVRGVYTNQGSIKGQYNEAHDQSSSFDFTSNYGGQYWDVGFGLSATVTGGEFAGNRLAFEWLEPVSDKVNGYQLQREGALSVSWGYAF